MKRLIRKILREEFNYKEKIFKLLNSGDGGLIEMVKYISEGQGYDLIDLLIEYFQEYGPPYLNIFNNLELSKEEQEYIMKKIYDYNIEIKGRNIYDDKDNQIYWEDFNGFWVKWEYDDKGNNIYFEDSDGDCTKTEHDDKGRIVYVEEIDGSWKKNEYDDNGNRIYEEHSNGYWVKKEYDNRGNDIYYEDSDGDIRDRR